MENQSVSFWTRRLLDAYLKGRPNQPKWPKPAQRELQDHSGDLDPLCGEAQTDLARPAGAALVLGEAEAPGQVLTLELVGREGCNLSTALFPPPLAGSHQPWLRSIFRCKLPAI